MPTTDPKTMAKRLRSQLAATYGLELTHSQSLELVAHAHGLRDWNTMVGRNDTQAVPWGARNATIPVLRIFSVDVALQFYVDFLGFQLDFGGPAGGEGTPYYGQISRASTTVHLSEVAYDPGPGATILIWLADLDALRDILNERRERVRVWGPAVWAPTIEPAPWDARVMTLADPFGNHFHFNEPNETSLRQGLPTWSS